MIQLNLMKAKASCDELDRLTPKFIDEAMDKVEKVYQLTIQIRKVSLSRKSATEKQFDIMDLTSQIMALTQSL